MELIWIDDFLALEQTRNFTRAAVMRNTTQSAYSRRVMRLEEWLNVKLFERETRPVKLTPEGTEFLSRAKRLREDILDTRRALQSLASHYETSLRIYTTNTLAIGFFAGWAKKEEIKGYSLVVASVRGCIEALKAGKANMALVPLLDDNELAGAWKTSVVGTDTLCLVSIKEIVSKVVLKDNILCGPIMLYSPGTAYGTRIDSILAEQSIELENTPVCESASAEALAAQVRAGMGAAWIPQSLMTPDMVMCNIPQNLKSAYKIVLLQNEQEINSD